MAGDWSLPSRADAVRFQPLGRHKLLPDAQLRQKFSDCGRQRFADTKILVGGTLDEGNEKPAAAQIERKSGAGGSASDHEHIK